MKQTYYNNKQDSIFHGAYKVLTETESNSSLTKNLNTERQIKQIGLKLANRGFKPDEMNRFDISNKDGKIVIAPWQHKDGTGMGIILSSPTDAYPTYSGIVYLPAGLKVSERELNKKWSTIQDLRKLADVYEPSEAAEWLDSRDLRENSSPRSARSGSINEEEDKMSEDEHKQIARDLYKKYGYDAHSIGDLMKELVILKGKFESEKKRKPDTNREKWDEYPDRRPRGDS